VTPRVTNDEFALVIEETDAQFDPERVRRMFECFHAISVEERPAEAIS
jgi:hypothetical protein